MSNLKIKYPANANTDEDKFAFCAEAEEALRMEHNIRGAQMMQGKLSPDKFNAHMISAFEDPVERIAIKTLAQSRGVISEFDFRSWQDVEYKRKRSGIGVALFNLKKGFAKKKKYNVNVDDIEDTT